MIQNNSLSLDFQSRFITDFNFGHYEHTTFYTLVDLKCAFRGQGSHFTNTSPDSTAPEEDRVREDPCRSGN